MLFVIATTCVRSSEKVLLACKLKAKVQRDYLCSPEEEARVRIMKSLCQIGRNGGDRRLRLECLCFLLLVLNTKLHGMNMSSPAYQGHLI